MFLNRRYGFLLVVSLIHFFYNDMNAQTSNFATSPLHSKDGVFSHHHQDMNSPLEINCFVAPTTDGDVVFCYQLTNVSKENIFVFDSPRMPYVIMQENGALLVLHGVNAPDPEVDYNVVEIPITQAVTPGSTISFKVNLNPLFLRDHFGKSPQPTHVTGSITVSCRVAWGNSPIEPHERHKLSLPSLLSWQKMAEGNSVEVMFP